MTLDSIVDKKFVSKKTYADNKQLVMAVDAEEAPEEFFFVHISFTPSIKTRLKMLFVKLFGHDCLSRSFGNCCSCRFKCPLYKCLFFLLFVFLIVFVF